MTKDVYIDELIRKLKWCAPFVQTARYNLLDNDEGDFLDRQWADQLRSIDDLVRARPKPNL